MNDSSKRKRTVISIEEKIRALKGLDDGKTVEFISKQYGVGISTVKDWRKRKDVIFAFVKETEEKCVLKQRKTMGVSRYGELDRAIWIWYNQERRRGTPISGPVLQDKALVFHQKLNLTHAFSASNGWLDKWKKRHGIHCSNIHGEKLSSDENSARQFVYDFNKLLKEEKYELDQIYNMDETGINYKMLPTKTLTHKNEKATCGFKINKERITASLCANASGTHKFPLFII